jgi:hypothetical protein
MLQSGASATDCGAASAVVHFSKFVITPTNPTLGNNLNVTAYGVASSSVATGATFHISVDYEGGDVFDYDGDVCGNSTIPLPFGVGNAYLNGFACPVPPHASATLAFGVEIPFFAPTGQYNITVTAATAAGAALACVDLVANFSSA